MGRKLQKKSAKLLELQGKVLEKRQQILDLKKAQEKSWNKDHTKHKLDSWRNLYHIVKLPDGSLRPPDKTYNIRAVRSVTEPSPNLPPLNPPNPVLEHGP
jgi:hypothetical protein